MPPAKKRRIAAAEAAAANAATPAEAEADGERCTAGPSSPPVSATNDGPAAILLERHREALRTLQGDIAELVKNGGKGSASELLLSSSLALADLKSMQRQISLQVESHANASKERRLKVEERGLMLENVNYERNYLRGEIGTMREWRAAELEKMARNELGIVSSKGGDDAASDKRGSAVEEGSGEVDVNGTEETPKQFMSAEEAIDAYLFGGDADMKSYRDPTNHGYVLQKLQSDIQRRSSLVEQLSKSKLELKEMQRKRDGLRGFLNQIPKRLAELEKAGESLNKFFGDSSAWKDAFNDNDGDVVMVCNDAENTRGEKEKVQAANLLVHRPSCNRTKRFRLARSNLPSPLYALFVQLAGYIDAWSSLEKFGGGKSSSKENAAVTFGEGEKTALSTLDGLVGAYGMDVSAVPPQEKEGRSGVNDGWSVALTLSPSEILPSEVTSILGKVLSSRSGSSSPLIKILFSFSPQEGVVFASVAKEDHAKGSCWGNAGGLLDNLFLGDDGSVNPNVSLSLMKEDEDIDEVPNKEGERQAKVIAPDDVTNHGKPYYWCQVLGGLNFPPPPFSSANTCTAEDRCGDKVAPFRVQACTRATFRQLLRRVRARGTLAAILEYVGRRGGASVLPVHPAMKSDDGADRLHVKAKLHSWAEDSKDGEKLGLSSYVKRYVATIKRKSATIRATAIVDLWNYPAKPPVWSLQNEDGSSGTLSSWGEEHGSVSALQQEDYANNNINNSNNTNASPLFDAALHRIECHINQDLEKFVRQDVETTYDWILIHQLSDIISCWDEAMSACEGGGAGRGGSGARSTDDVMGMMTAGAGYGRLRKGRDRRLTGFGERSQFYWYRNGL